MEWCFNSMMQVSGKWPHVLFPTSGPSWSGLGSTLEVRSQRCETALPVVRLPPPLVSDVSVHQWSMSSLRTRLIVHHQRGLAAAGRTSSELLLFFFFGGSRGWDPTCFLSSVNGVSLLSLFTSVCFSCCKLGGDSGEKSYCRCLIDATYVFVFESEFLFNNTPDPLFPGVEEWKGTFFSNCRGCNSMLSKPFVLQKLHLFFSWLIYRGCCSSRRLDRNNYAASKTS